MVFDYLGLIGSVTLIHLLAVMSPGPDFLVVMKHALTRNRRVAIFTSLGIGAGIMVHVMYSFIGLAIIISNSKWLFNVIKYLGAIYLLYLGIMSISSRAGAIKGFRKIKKEQDYGDFKSFQIGFLTNVLNPKATLFFLSLFTIVIGSDTPQPVLILISTIMVVNTALWFVFLSYVITIEGVRRKFQRFERWFNLVFGVLLIIVALRIALG